MVHGLELVHSHKDLAPITYLCEEDCFILICKPFFFKPGRFWIGLLANSMEPCQGENQFV